MKHCKRYEEYEKIVFSGVQPTGEIHIGNYLGAIKNWADMVKADKEQKTLFIFCIVDLHSITIKQNPSQLNEAIFKTFASYIACGIDPKQDNVIVFTQSSVSEHAELAWVLSTITSMGLLDRMTQYKDKTKNNKERSNLGLYSYPVLMASDILLYQTNLVPVGEDQIQHVELARDIAIKFNSLFGSNVVDSSFVTDNSITKPAVSKAAAKANEGNCYNMQIPEYIVNADVKRIMSLKDGLSKMSKSDPLDGSRISLFDSQEVIFEKIKKAKTDTIQGIYHNKQERPEISNLISIFSAFSGQTIEQIQNTYANKQTSQFKLDLAEQVAKTICPIGELVLQMLKDKQTLQQLINLGNQKAKSIAYKNFSSIKNAIGFYVD